MNVFSLPSDADQMIPVSCCDKLFLHKDCKVEQKASPMAPVASFSFQIWSGKSIALRTAEGVPFQWEMQPGTSKNQPEEESIRFPFPPLSPPPHLQNKLLPLPNPCLDQDHQPKNNTKFFWFLKRIKITELYDKLAHQSLSRRRCTCTCTGTQNTNQSHGDFTSSLINHSCSCSSCSSTLSSSRNHGSLSSSWSSVRRESLDDVPFCCSPWNVTAVMEEGNRRIYYCRDHKTAFAIEKDGSFLSKIILSRVSSSIDHQSSFHRIGEGIPFQWEMKPGRPIDPPEEEVIPPPTPPPALQSLAAAPLPSPHSHDSVKSNKSSGIFWNWINVKKTKKTTTLVLSASDDNGGDSSVSRSSSSSIPILRLNSEEQLKLSCFNFKPWN